MDPIFEPILEKESDWQATEISNLQNFDEFIFRSHQLPSFSGHKKLCDRLWPMADTIDSQADCIFLSEVLDVKLLAKKPLWFLRDGLVPLSWFFTVHPRPPSWFKSTLGIHHQLLFVVPPEWQTFVKGYECLSVEAHLQEFNTKENAEISISGILLSPYLNPQTVSLHVQQIEDLQRKYQTQNLRIFTPLRDWKFFSPVKSDYYMKVGIPLNTLQGLKHCDAEDFCKINFKSNRVYYDLNDLTIVAEPMLKHYFQTSGIRSFGLMQGPAPLSIKGPETHHPVTFKYGFNTFSVKWHEIQMPAFYQNLFQVQKYNSEAILNSEFGNWFNWMEYWLTE